MPETIGEAFVAIRPDTKNFEAQAKGGISTALKGIAAGIAAVKVGEFFGSAIDEARDAQKVGAQTTAVLKSTGNAANTTADAIGELSSKLSEKAGVDDEVIQSGANMLLTFTNIRNEVGKGNDIFDRTTAVALDLATAMKASTGGEVDLKGASIQLGKALNDPVKGITALTRVGVTFTQQQKDQIGLAVLFGDTLGAQKIILGEVEKEFGGSAAAQATAADKASVAWGNLKETIGTALLPVLDKLMSFATPILEFFSQNQEAAAALAIVVGVTLVGAFAAWAAGAVAASATTLLALAPFLPVIAAIGLAIYDGVELWKRYGNDVVSAIQPAIDVVNGLYNAAKDVLEFLGLIDEETSKRPPSGVTGPNAGLYGTGLGGPNYNAPVSQYNPAQGLYGTGVGNGPALDLSFLNDPNNPYNMNLAFLNDPNNPYNKIAPPYLFAGGGWVPGTGTGDKVPAMLTPGEYVMSKDEVASAQQSGDALHFHFPSTPDDPFAFAVKVASKHRVVAQAMRR